MARLIGLTGGIGMGKTTVSNYLATTHQLPILDADVYAREAVQPGGSVLTKIVDRYGSQVLQAGALDRRRLGEIIFNNAAERTWLEQQIHPFVRRVLTKERDRLVQKFDPIVLVIPLLFEAKMTDLITEIWVVYCPPEQQIQRLIQRESLTLEQAQARINSQRSIAEKCDRADVVLDNSSTLEHLLEQVDQALNKPHWDR